MHRFMKLVASVVVAAAVSPIARAQDWVFDPHYDLPRRAAVKAEAAADPAILVDALPPAPVLFGSTATHSLILADSSPAGDFTAELWMLDHVNQPVGALLSVGNAALAYHSDKAAFGPRGSMLAQPLAKDGYKRHWRHVLLTREGGDWTLYENGVALARAVLGRDPLKGAIRLDAYLAAEPYMGLENLVQLAAVTPGALTAGEAAARFAARAKLVDEGRLFADRLHFTQPPYLNTPQETSIELSFEFDRPVAATIEYGVSADALRRIEPLGDPKRLGGLRLADLSPDTPYFYRVSGVDRAGNKLDSGLLSFRTAPPAGRPFSFVVTGDTEARPHINNRLSQLVWEERPNLIAIMGDLTDGGSTQRRFEWTHEYFRGMGPLFGRVPVIGVPGNGEGELDWYRHYHRNPGEENFFSLVYGDVEFFVLDSNLGSREKSDPGFRARQKAWLERVLKASTARWKIAMHHHPVRTSDEDDYGDTFKEASEQGDAHVQADFLPLYEAYGIDFVFFAHLHSYERSWPLSGSRVDLASGMTLVQVGGAGGNLEDFSPNRPWFSRNGFRNYHYAVVSVTPNQIEVRVVDIDGRLRDVFDVRKP